MPYKGNIFALDWCNLEQIKPVAKQLRGVIVKHLGRDNYNICPSTAQALKSGAVIVFDYSVRGE